MHALTRRASIIGAGLTQYEADVRVRLGPESFLLPLSLRVKLDKEHAKRTRKHTKYSAPDAPPRASSRTSNNNKQPAAGAVVVARNPVSTSFVPVSYPCRKFARRALGHATSVILARVASQKPILLPHYVRF